MIDLYIGSEKDNKRKIDIDDDIEIVRQVMDIFDISTRVVDYSKTIKLSKTANTREILGGLGFSDSDFPYTRSYADVYSSGILLMNNAFVKVKDVEKFNYNLNLISESKEIWKVIENDTLLNLDLSDTDHTKDPETIKNLWETGIQEDTKFFYIYADYGGKLSNGTVYAQYQIPSYRLSYLIDKINTKYNVEVTLPERLKKTFLNFSDANEVQETNDKDVFHREYSEFVRPLDVEKFTIEEDGNYYLKITGEIVSPLTDITFVFGSNEYTYKGNLSINLTTPIFPLISKQQGFYIKAADVPIKISSFKGRISIIRKAVNISGNVAFKDYKITDLLKEIIYQTGAIPIKKPFENKYEFVTLREIFDNDVEDWSNYFNEQTKESYVIGKYAQNNWFRYKYEDTEDVNKDGLIKVENINLDINADVIKSTLFNTPVTPTTVTLGGTEITTGQYQLWKRTTQQVNGEFEESYNPLSGRMFFIEGESMETGSDFSIETDGIDNVTTNKITIANNENYNFMKVVNDNYQEYSKILQRAKIKTATFKIPLITFANFDFKRRIYIKQLGGNFIINKMILKTQHLMELELIQANFNFVDTTPSGPDPEIPAMSLVFQINSSTYRSRIVIDDTQYTETLILFNSDLHPGELELLIDGVLFPYLQDGNIISFQFYAITELSEGDHIIKIQKGTDYSNEITLRLTKRNKPEIEVNPYNGKDKIIRTQH